MIETATDRIRITGPFGGLCGIEMFERLAYFSVRSVLVIYIMQADDAGGLQFTAGQKAGLLSALFAVQCVLSALIGGYADRYGYRRTLLVAILTIMAGYLCMAFVRGYGLFFAAVMLLAAGTALFKPSLQGGLARMLDSQTASVGWGIFFWVVNVGSLAGPFIATLALGPTHSREAWQALYLIAAGLMIPNLVLWRLVKDIPHYGHAQESPLRVFIATLSRFFQPRLLVFFLLLSAYWAVAWQLWDLYPNFISDWVDSSRLAARLEWLPAGIHERLTERGAMGVRVPAQLILNLNAVVIVLFVVPLSWLVRRVPTLKALSIGIALAALGIAVAGLTQNGWILLFGIMLFAFGAMLTEPKQLEHLALVAPGEEKARYLGYLNLPVGVGGMIGSWLAAHVYGRYGEKASLALRYLAEHTAPGAGKGREGKVSALSEALGVERTEAFETLRQSLGLDASAATRLLWETYRPHYYVWMPFLVVGLAAACGMAVFAATSRRAANPAAAE